ncbi:MAG: LysR family transcriptional regulator [Rhodospirillaceae bacterium]|nr:LysR family transcriptional regulator [Rhodospirillaceae bacterium]MBT5677129.1 LysR family transcriptional regulator [Rhodospirillaceae bacterium]
MILKQFSYLIALAQERHFGRAAKRCNVAQPTLSTAIRRLEDELGVPIVMRGQRFIGFTAEGQRVLEWAERILADQDAMVQELSEMRDSLHGRLRIGVVPTALPVVSRLTYPFCERHPKVSVAARAMSSIEIQHGLDNFELDLGITYLDNEAMPRVKSAPLYVEQYCLVRAFAGKESGQESEISWKDAAELPLCLLSRDMQNRRIIDAAFAAAGCRPTPQIETNDLADLGLHVKTGKWAAIVPRHVLDMLDLPQGSEALDLVAPVISHAVGLVVADREPRPPTAKAMLALVETIGVGGIFEPTFNQ